MQFRSVVSISALAVLALGAEAQAQDASKPTGTVQGNVTTQGGLPLNGVCVVLYNKKVTKELIDFAGSGSAGTDGFYTQANVPVGSYRLLFTNCGANTNGQSPDFNYETIFYGGTFAWKKSPLITVSAGLTTDLGTQEIPLGGTVSGTVTDATTGQGADTPPVFAVPPQGSAFFLAFSWKGVCANAQGQYQIQGVPAGSHIYFAPNNWGCDNSQGTFNAGFFNQSVSHAVSPPPDGTRTVNGSITETGGTSTARAALSSATPGSGPFRVEGAGP